MAEEVTALDRLSKQLGGLPEAVGECKRVQFEDAWVGVSCDGTRVRLIPETLANDAFQALAAIALEALERADALYKRRRPCREAEVAQKRYEDAEAALAEALEKQEQTLASMYAMDTVQAYVAVARVCDGELDRSGALLGRVRSLALGKRRPTEEEGD